MTKEVEALARLDLHQLRDEWQRRFGPVAMFRSAELLRLMLAWRIQATMLGGLDPDTLKALARSGTIEPEGRHLGVDGQHEAIVDPALFDEVQAMLAAHRRSRTTRQRMTSPLLGKPFDAAGRRMSPTYSRGARGSVYRYYVSSSASGQRLARVSARTIEALLLSGLTRLLPELADPLGAVAKVRLADGEIIVTLAAAFSRTIKRHLEPDETVEPNGIDDKLVDLHLPASLGSRNARATIRPTSTPAGRRDPVLIKALRTAHAMIELTRGGAPIIETVPGPRYQRRLLRLAFLSPDIQRAILAGRQPAGLRLEDLVRNDVPTDWNEQQRWIEGLAR